MPLPIGELLENPTSAPRPARTTLEGRYCKLVPLDATAHAQDLWAAGLNNPANDDLWLYLGDGPYHDYTLFEAAIAKKLPPKIHCFIRFSAMRATRWASAL